MKNKLIDLINKNVFSEKYIKKNYKGLYNEILIYNKEISTSNWKEMVYNYVNNISILPTCECGEKLSLINVRLGYRKFCSKSCSNKSSLIKEKKKQKNREKYGVDHPMKDNKYRENYNSKILEKYGVSNISQSQEIKNKKTNTLIENYGVTHQLKSNEIKNKIVDSNLRNWGVDNVSKSKIVSNTKKDTMQKKWGVDYGFESDIIKDRIKKTINEKYGVDYYVTSHENKLRIKTQMDEKRKLFWAEKLNITVDDIKINYNEITITNYCKTHNKFQINRYNLYNRVIVGGFENICILCNPISENSSIKENELRNFINNELNIYTNKIKINGKEIDIYIPSHKIGIEFNGLYWHSDLHKDSNYHFNKTKDCEEQGIQLLHVFEDEWIFRKEIVKSIINSKLGLYDDKIYARKTKVLEIIDNKLIREFLNTNHLQGFVGSSVKLGLFHENELVSVMTFGKKRIAMGSKTSLDGEYEMLRFCNKLNTQIVGGASKLLKYFIKTYNPKYITSFADRRYSNGDLYKNLEFKYVGNTLPNYWYFKTNEMVRHYRFGFRKDVLVREGFNKEKTEREIMIERGYLRIYDCGNMKFELFI